MVWCVEDDAGIRELEMYTLKTAGYETRGFENGRDFLEALNAEIPDLVILDIMLPETDGITILKTVKKSDKFKDIPFILATARGEEYDKIKGFETGADDYIVKPFSMMEMVARVKAVLKRTMPKNESTALKFDALMLNPETHTVTVNGEKVMLTYKEFELLRLFLSRPGIVFTREQLFADVWGSDYMGDTRTLDMHIKTLRQKLKDYGKKIETIRNVGYRLEADDGKKNI